MEWIWLGIGGALGALLTFGAWLASDAYSLSREQRRARQRGLPPATRRQLDRAARANRHELQPHARKQPLQIFPDAADGFDTEETR